MPWEPPSASIAEALPGCALPCRPRPATAQGNFLPRPPSPFFLFLITLLSNFIVVAYPRARGPPLTTVDCMGSYRCFHAALQPLKSNLLSPKITRMFSALLLLALAATSSGASAGAAAAATHGTAGAHGRGPAHHPPALEAARASLRFLQGREPSAPGMATTKPFAFGRKQGLHAAIVDDVAAAHPVFR